MTDEALLQAQTENARLSLAAEIVSAYVSNNAVPKGELPGLIASVRDAVGATLTTGATASAAPVEKASAADIRKSITPDALISFIDGKAYKTLKRHLTSHGLTIEGYRAKFGLPVDYPTVAPNYSAARSALAKNLGLGVPAKKRAA